MQQKAAAKAEELRGEVDAAKTELKTKQSAIADALALAKTTEAKRIETGLWALLLLGERAEQVLGEQFEDGLARLGNAVLEVELSFLRQRGEVEGAAAEERGLAPREGGGIVRIHGRSSVQTAGHGRRDLAFPTIERTHLM